MLYTVRAVCDVTFRRPCPRSSGGFTFFRTVAHTHLQTRATTKRTRPADSAATLSPSRQPLATATAVRRSDSTPLPTCNARGAVIARTGNPTDRRGGRGRAAFTPTIFGGDGG